MIYKNEKQLLNIIKFTPTIFILSISIIITIFLYSNKENELEPLADYKKQPVI